MKFAQNCYHLANSLLDYDQKSHCHHINHRTLHHIHQKVLPKSFNLIIFKQHSKLFTKPDYNEILILNFKNVII